MPIDSHWYRPSYTWLTLLLLPLSWLFRLIVSCRCLLYRSGVKKTFRFPVLVIVVGNITVGGTGKTPFVIWLAGYLKSMGWRPGIVSRGVGGNQALTPRWVASTSDPRSVGDEAVLLARRTLCPVVVAVDRVAAVADLLDKSDCNIIISDDGLQHYRLGRDIEIAIVDGVRRFGNHSLLPAGPLREPVSRLAEVDFVVTQQQPAAGEYQMQLCGDGLVSISRPDQKMPLASLKNTRIHGVAAIGNPDQFFDKLRQAGLEVIPHPFSDHYLYQGSDLEFGDNLPVIMTEKDAVKCALFADDRYWYLPVNAEIGDGFEVALGLVLQKKMG